jgi:hypothetical protein
MSTAGFGPMHARLLQEQRLASVNRLALLDMQRRQFGSNGCLPLARLALALPSEEAEEGSRSREQWRKATAKERQVRRIEGMRVDLTCVSTAY